MTGFDDLNLRTPVFLVIVTFMPRFNFMLGLVEHEKSFIILGLGQMSLVMRKPAFCYRDSTIPLLTKSEISSL